MFILRFSTITFMILSFPIIKAREIYTRFIKWIDRLLEQASEICLLEKVLVGMFSIKKYFPEKKECLECLKCLVRTRLGSGITN